MDSDTSVRAVTAIVRSGDSITDAVESMAVHSVSYLVSTRLMAGLIAIVPLYALSVLAAFFGAWNVDGGGVMH